MASAASPSGPSRLKRRAIRPLAKSITEKLTSVPEVANDTGGCVSTHLVSTAASGCSTKAEMSRVTHGSPAGKAPCEVVGKVMTVLALSVCAARMPLAGGVMGSKRPLSTRVGTVLVTGWSSSGARSRTRQAWHRLLMARLDTSWSLAILGRMPG